MKNANEIRKGKATLLIEFKGEWDELVKLVKYLQGNPLSKVVEVHIGEEVFDA